MIGNVAGIISDEVSKMNNTMPWPPSETDLTPDKVKIGENLDAFLNTLLTGRLLESNSLRVNRLSSPMCKISHMECQMEESRQQKAFYCHPALNP